jgi:hypothetical protein
MARNHTPSNEPKVKREDVLPHVGKILTGRQLKELFGYSPKTVTHDLYPIRKGWAIHVGKNQYKIV